MMQFHMAFLAHHFHKYTLKFLKTIDKGELHVK